MTDETPEADGEAGAGPGTEAGPGTGTEAGPGTGAGTGAGAATDAATSARSAALASVLVVSLVLAWNAAAGPQPFDPGELAAAAVRLGGSHAPGQPLHALLGWAAIHLVPLGPIAWRLSLLSTLGAAIAALAFARIVEELLPEGITRSAAMLATGATAIAVMLAPTVLRQAARPEVYTLALAGFALGALCLVRWARAPRGHRGLLAAALVSGLVFSLHPPHALALALLGVVLALSSRRDVFRSGRAVLGALVFGMIGLAFVVYLPLRASVGASMWGDPTSLGGLWSYVSGHAYATNLVPHDDHAALPEALRLFVVGGGGVPMLVALVAVAFLVRGEARLSPAVGLTGAAFVLVLPATLFFPDERVPDHVAYLGPAVATSIAGAALGLAFLATHRPSLAGVGLVSLAFVPTGLPDLPRNLVADLPALESLGFALVDAPPPRALALVATDFVAGTWMMDAAVDRTRPDVALFAEGLATSSWHWRSLAGHPAVPDGAPSRAGDGDGPEPWIRGVVARASGAVPISAERHDAIVRFGWVDGAYVRTPPPGAHPGDARRTSHGSGETALASVATTLAWAAPGDHGVGAEILRALVVSRAQRLFFRGEVATARTAILAATAPLPSAAVQELEGIDQPPYSDAPPAIRDPGGLYMTPEDAVRVGATLLHAAGHRAMASRVLELQLERGELRAMLQLGWMLYVDGAVSQARDLVDLYVRSAPEHAEEALPLVEALARTAPP